MKLYRNIIITVIVIGLLVTGIVLLNQKPKDTTKEDTKKEEQVVQPDPINVLTLDAGSIVKMAVKTQDEDYTITKSGETFVISNSNNIKIDSYSLSAYASILSDVISYQLVTEKPEDAKLYGFDEPSGSVTISMADGKSHIIHIGNKTIDGKGNYIKLSDENKIYSMSANEMGFLTPSYEDFVSSNIFSLDPTYTTLSYFEIGKSGNKPYRFNYSVEEKDGTTLTSWKMSTPIKAEANVSTLTEKVITPLETFAASGVKDARPEDLSIYGLDKPYATLTIASSAVTHKYKFGKEEGGIRYFMADNYASVYMMDAKNAEFIDVAYIDLIERNVHVENVKKISKVEIKTPDVEYVMDIKDGTYTINGKKIGDSFTKAYQAIIGMRFDDINSSFKGGTAEATIKYTRTDGTTCTLSYVPIDEVNYFVRVDGSGYAVISKSTFNEAMSVIKKVYDEA